MIIHLLIQIVSVCTFYILYQKAAVQKRRREEKTVKFLERNEEGALVRRRVIRYTGREYGNRAGEKRQSARRGGARTGEEQNDKSGNF